MPMPFDNPPFPVSAVTFGERYGITLLVKTDTELLRSLVPPPLEVLGSEILLQQHVNIIAHPTQVTYPNATVFIPASLGGRDGFYVSRIYEGSDQATMLTIWGREIWGFPKIAGDVSVTHAGTRAESRVTATNVAMHVELDVGDTKTTQPATNIAFYCRKTIPAPDCGGLDVDRIIEVPVTAAPEERFPAEVKRCEIEFDLDSESVKLPVKEFTAAFWMEQQAGTILETGKVVHDYLNDT